MGVQGPGVVGYSSDIAAVKDFVHRYRILKRQACRNSLIEYTKHTFPAYITAPHLEEISDHLQMAERREIDRLIIVEPPRHGKSLLTSQRFPSWYMGRNPTDEIIHCSYGGELVSGFGRRLRNLMTSEMHQDVFPHGRLAGDSKAANLWHTEQDGVYVAAGVGGPITGRGAHLLLVDDPVKSREEADSERMRERVWEWYQNDAYTRLMPGGVIIIISTRWHEDDLVGRLLREQEAGGDKWTVLHHPAIDDDGMALWSDRYPVPVLDRIRRNVGPRAWNALYQGDPAPDEGQYFERDWFKYGVAPPRNEMNIYAASDYAVSDGEGDYTVHVVIGIDNIERMWLLDLWRKQATADKWVASFLDLVRRWEPIAWAEEKGQIEKAVGPFLTRMMNEQKTYVNRIGFASKGGSKPENKRTRARSIQARMSVRGLWLPAGAWYAGMVENELLKFPTGQYDDIVDTLSLIGRMVAGLEAGKGPNMNAPDQGVTLNQLWKEQDRHDRRW